MEGSRDEVRLPRVRWERGYVKTVDCLNFKKSNFKFSTLKFTRISQFYTQKWKLSLRTEQCPSPDPSPLKRISILTASPSTLSQFSALPPTLLTVCIRSCSAKLNTTLKLAKRKNCLKENIHYMNLDRLTAHSKLDIIQVVGTTLFFER